MISMESCVLFVMSTLIPVIMGQEDDKHVNLYKHPDIQAERNKDMYIGIAVGVCCACVFLVLLCITYNYYKNKPYRNVPRDEA